MVQRGDRLDAGLQQRVHQPGVEVDALGVERPGPARLDPRPGHREPVGLQAEVLDQRDVLGPPVVVIVGDVAGVAVQHLARGPAEGVPDGRSRGRPRRSAPSIWYDAVADPQRKSVGKVRCGLVIGGVLLGRGRAGCSARVMVTVPDTARTTTPAAVELPAAASPPRQSATSDARRQHHRQRPAGPRSRRTVTVSPVACSISNVAPVAAAERGHLHGGRAPAPRCRTGAARRRRGSRSRAGRRGPRSG